MEHPTQSLLHKLVTAEPEVIPQKEEGISKKMILIEGDLNWGGEHTIKERKKGRNSFPRSQETHAFII